MSEMVDPGRLEGQTDGWSRRRAKKAARLARIATLMKGQFLQTGAIIEALSPIPEGKGDLLAFHLSAAAVSVLLEEAELTPKPAHHDLDLASHGLVAVLDQARGSSYPDMAREPKQAFGALAAAYARARTRPATF